MKHYGFSKLFSWILTAIMILTALPLSSIPSRAESVDTEEKETHAIWTEESDVLESDLSDPQENTEETVSGVCGNLTWTLDDEGILTISGEGYMGSAFSWEEYKDRIQTVLIEDGVKSVTSYAFSGYPNIRRISIGKGVTSIGPGAFEECPYLDEIFFNAYSLNDQEAETYSFYNSGISGSGITLTVGDEVESFPSELCSSIRSLKNVTFGKKVRSIGKGAFYSCTGLTSITFGESISSIGIDTFFNCRGLKTITFLGDKPSFGSNSFTNVTCDGYYPYGNITWAPLPSLGSSVHITWIPFGITSLSTITFDANGGNGQMEVFYFATAERSDNTFLPQNTFTRNNYAFLGWNTKADGTGTFFTDGARVNPTDDWIEQWNEEEGAYILTEDSLTLYAQWTDRIQISFDANGGEGVMDNMVIFLYENNDSTFLPLCYFVRNGYVFCGWNTKADGTGRSYVDGARVNPTVGWLENEEYEADEYLIVNQQITLYAQWTENAQISFDANGGEGEMESIWVSPSERNDNTFLPQNTFTREGYSFRGWNTKADGTGKFCKDGARVNPTEDWIENYGWESDDGYIIVNQSITLYAQWIKDEIVIHFDPNGGVGEMEDFIVPKTFNWEQLPYHAFSREQYDFIGWNTKPDGTGVGCRDEVYVGRSVEELNDEYGISGGDFICVTDDATLYAQWSKKEVKVLLTKDENDDAVEMRFVYDSRLYQPETYPWFERVILAVWNGDDVTGPLNEENPYRKWYSHAEQITNVYFDSSFAEVRPVSTAGWFRDFINLDYLSGIEYLNTSEVTDMSGMFRGCSNMTYFNLEHFDTSSVTDMSSMFMNCSSLEELDLSNFDTSKVENMENMFYSCSSLRTIYCKDSDTDWNRSEEGVFNIFNSENTKTSLKGWYGEQAVTYYAGGDGGAFAKSAKLGGYFTPRNLKINFDANGGEGTMDPVWGQAYAYDWGMQCYVGPIEVTFVKGGYKFTGWNTKPDGSGISYGAEQTLYIQQDLLLYAQWRAYAGPQVIRTSDGTLTFLYSTIDYLERGQYNGQSIEYAWTGEAVTNTGDYPGWRGWLPGSSKVVIDESFSAVLPKSTAQWFGFEYSWVDHEYSIEGLEFLNTSEVIDMKGMFQGAPYTSLDLHMFDTSHVTDMSGMFQRCYSLVDLDLNGLNASRVTNVSNIFQWCDSLTELNLSCVDFSGLSDMSGMFQVCYSLKNLNLEDIVTINVTDMSNLFNGCRSLSSLNLNGLNTSKVTDMSAMFADCELLTGLDLHTFDTSSVSNMSSMFAGCRSLTAQDLRNFNTSNVTNMSNMFSGCSGLNSLDLSVFDTSSVTDMSYMFSGCSGLNSLDLSTFDTSSVTDMSYMFGTYNEINNPNTSLKIKSLDLSSFDTSSVTNMSGMFSGCSGLTTLDLSGFDTSHVQTMDRMFHSCLKLEKLDLSSFDLSNVTKPDLMFENCKRLSTIYCNDSDSAWPEDYASSYSQGILFGSNTNLTGRYGKNEVKFNEGYADGEMARSAKLGGYFTPKNLGISFSANGGDGQMESMKVLNGLYDANGVKLPVNCFTKDCYRFSDWNTKADGSGDSYGDAETILPLEDLILYAQWEDHHDWDAAIYTWSADYRSVTAKSICKKNADHMVTETVSTTRETVEPTCEEGGYTLVTAVFENEAFETQTVKINEKPALGHKYGEAFYHWANDNQLVTAMAVCENDSTHIVTEAAETTSVEIPPTADGVGYRIYTAVFENEVFETQTKTVIIPATGHTHKPKAAVRENEVPATCEKDGSYDLVIYCSECGEVILREKVTVPALGHLLVRTEAMAPTCETAGNSAYWTCSRCKKYFSDAEGKTEIQKDSWVIAATGHDWNAPAFTWTGLTSATATRTCKRDASHKETVNAVITNAVTKEPTATEDGVRTYTATATFSDGTKVTDTKTEVIPATGEPTEEGFWTRLAGSSRFNTMKAIVDEAYPASENRSLKTLIVATGESFPDALSGAALAGVYNCPIITTKSSSLSAQAKSEIQRLAAKDCRVIILGGELAVSKEVENAIKGMGLTVDRVAGTTRVKTAIEVYNKGASEANGFRNSDTVIITTGFNYADALSISPYAYASKTPILLTNKDGSLAADVKGVITKAGFKKAIVVGGTGAVSADTEAYLKGQGLTVLRLDGSNRYVTSAQIMKWEMGLLKSAAFQPAVKMTNAGMGVATGENYPDALASAGLLGRTKSVLMLVSNTKSRGTIQKNINELIKPYANEMKKGYIFGGETAVSKEIETLLNEAVK